MNGQTDRILIARLRLHSMQRGKNVAVVMHCNLRSPEALITRPNTKFEVGQKAVCSVPGI